MPKRTDQPDTTFHTIAAACAATGLSRHTIGRAKKERPDIVLTDGGRLRLAGICQWLMNRSADPAPDSDSLERLRKARAQREEFRLQKDKGEYYLAAEVEEAIIRTVSKMQRELERRLLAVVPGEGAHLSARALQGVMKDHLGKWADYCQSEAAKLKSEVNR